jgi:hypothetical protein
MIDLTKSYVVRNSPKIITEIGVCSIKLSTQAHKRRNSIKVPKFSKKCGVSQEIWCLCLSLEIIKRYFFEMSRKTALLLRSLNVEEVGAYLNKDLEILAHFAEVKSTAEGENVP